MEPEKIFIIDAHGFLHRNYHALPKLTTSRGEEVGALYGFIRLLLKIIREKKPGYMAVCFDSPGKNFRHELYPGYKATRRETEEALKTQLSSARELVSSLGLKAVAAGGYEADDIMATIARKSAEAGLEAVLVTGDKDVLQLVSERIKVWNGGDSPLMGPAEVKEKYGFGPEHLADYFALAGDSTDNIPGVRGIGPKTAGKLVSEYGSLPLIIEKASGEGTPLPKSAAVRIKENAGTAELCRKLAVLDSNVPLSVEVEDCRVSPPEPDSLMEMYKRLEFKDLLALARSGQASVSFTLPEVSDWGTFIKKAASAESVFIQAAGDWLCAGTPDGDVSLRKIPELGKADRELLEKMFSDGGISKAGHDFKTSLHLLGMEFQGLSGVFDTAIAAYCLNPSAAGYDYFKTASEYLGPVPEVAVQPDELLAHSLSAWKLKTELEKKLEENGLVGLYREIEEPLIGVLAAMEKRGIRVDIEYLKNLGRELERKMLSIQTGINEVSGSSVNLNSPKQLGFLLFEKLRLPAGRRTKTGYSTDEEVLISLSGAHPAVGKILEYREASKLKSSFIDNLVEMADPSTGRLHTSFDQTGTSTGRLSSSRPNLQNIPVRSELGQAVRRAFVPEPGSVFLSADYSQIDLRVLAHVSADPVLTQAFLSGEDIHLKTACEVFNLAPGQVDKETRRRAKAINFGIVYGQTAAGLSAELGISREEAKNYIDHYFGVYSGVAQWTKKNLEAARASGFVTTLTGRRRYLPELNSPNGSVRAFAERAAVNTPVQGGSADIIKKAMIDLDEKMRPGPARGARMLLQVHDELLFEVPEGEVEACAGVIKSGMESAFSLKVPLVVELKAGKNWQDMEKL